MGGATALGLSVAAAVLDDVWSADARVLARWGTVIVRLDPSSPLPPYEQLRSQVAASIVAGELPPGHQLPPIRQLAADLELAPGTVARAYRELESAGLVVSHGRRGTRVADRLPAVDAAQLADQLEAAARAYATTLRRLGVSFDDGVAALRSELDGEPAASGG